MNELKKFILNFLSEVPELTFTKKHLLFKLKIAKIDLDFVNYSLNEQVFNSLFNKLRQENLIEKRPNSNSYKLIEPKFTNDFFILFTANQRNQLKTLHETTSQWGEKKTIYYYNHRIENNIHVEKIWS